MIYIFYILFVFSSLLQQGNFIYDCQKGIATRHDVFELVLKNKPWREVNDVDGYIGVGELEDLEQYYTLFVPGEDGWEKYRVFSADVRSEDHKADAAKVWDGQWIADIDKAIWYDANVPNRPVYVVL